ncbi:Hypothetical protein PP7435_CHR3-0623 [Komagataella phaffii CBS 7435]|uniref:Ribosome biogenesis protein SLX9 n=1 Tax=Komagataella phaffii (strain ATCC 76273 / CBS 7435 / CECT 11047 / NRRL Y-11430 / Wegner 21-1) TaxID=981350 RepID=F2QW02_KOMPC|nr:GQ67_03659T0 [Komagataella phaffii]AOA68474.1 GQ68_03631T0 [Komagataella phaffii GS115]CAH2449601.1 Hypothetical protein BQ9382_C3-3310 [Komagataella phaffii CBS 7435]CCA39580.1 Hypothetical protein PP7435_CHR3-0623 [Komagataella phaffii CBS 7435]
MAGHKRTTLRNKVESRQTSRVVGATRKVQKSSLLNDHNAFLRRNKTTKVQKRLDKTLGFVQKMKQKADYDKIANRNSYNDRLKPKLEELLDVLPGGDEIRGTQPGHGFTGESAQFIQAPARKGPNPTGSLKSRRAVTDAETQRFRKILQDEQFKKSPFEALRNQISGNMTQEERTTKERK